LIQDIAAAGLRADLCAVGEPSGVKPILSYKGKFNLNVMLRGLTGHSSAPSNGVNAGEAIARVACEARRPASRLLV
jgi:acetylornithine deacetylase